MDLGIAGMWAIVGASSRGLGKGCAAALLRAGCHVVINGLDEERLDQTRAELSGLGDVHTVAGDVGTPEVRAQFMSTCPQVDILVTNNGGPPVAAFEELEPSHIMAGIEKNMITPITLIQAALPGMKERRFGRIVNITSSSVLAPIPGLDVSSGARAGLTGLLAGVAKTAAGHNVTINNLLPGKMDTDRLRGNLKAQAKRSGKSEHDVADASIQSIPAGRFGTADEFGEVCAFLCSQQAGYLTGQNILLDGGLLGRAF
ncbi:MAG: SDR family oxidoreductase [Pseudomonadota bacterium]